MRGADDFSRGHQAAEMYAEVLRSRGLTAAAEFSTEGVHRPIERAFTHRARG